MAATFALAQMVACTRIPDGRSAVSEVSFSGVTALDEDDLQERLATTATPRFVGLVRGLVFDYEVFNIYVLRRDLQRVERYYRARGYYQAKARAGRVTYHDDNQLVRVRIVVDEGPATHIEQLRVSGLAGLRPELQAQVLQAARSEGIDQRMRFDEDHFEAAEGAIQRALTDNGYAHATVERVAQVDIPANQAYLEYKVKPGPLAVYGEISFAGFRQLPERELRRTLDLYEGESYSTEAIDDAERALLHTGLFSTVRIGPNLTAATGGDGDAGASGDDESNATQSLGPETSQQANSGSKKHQPVSVVPLEVRVRVAKYKSVRLGVGAQADARQTDVHLIAGWEHRNLFGGLRRFGVDFKPGLVLYPTRIPGLDPPERLLPQQRLRFELVQPGWVEARTNLFLRTQYSIFPLILAARPVPGAPILGYHELQPSLGVDRVIGHWYGLFAHNVQFNAPFTYAGQRDPALGNVLISYPNFFLSLDLTDDSIAPHSGLRVSNDLQVAGVGGDAFDVRLEPEVAGYVPLGRHVTFALRGKLGLLFPQNYGEFVARAGSGDIPDDTEREAWLLDAQVSYLRSFFSGGPTSNRGYAFNAVGPHGVVPFYLPQSSLQDCALDDTSPECAVPLGGFSLWETSAEFRYPVSGPLGAVTFCDASDVARDQLTFRGNPHLSCGQGLRYATPVGPIRFDVGYRLPGLQRLSDPDRNEGEPGEILGLPIAISIGLGKAF